MYITGSGKAAQIFVVQICQGFLDIHIAVEIDKGVFRTIICLMEVQEGVLRELRNSIRIAAGLKAIAGIREQSLQRFVL